MMAAVSKLVRNSGRTQTVELKQILFATDFSEVSAKALPYAAAIARGFGSTLCVVHVIPKSDYEHIPEAHREATLEKLRDEAEQRVNALLAATHFRGVRHEVRVGWGEVLAAVEAEAHRRNADLIVVGMHGRHGLEKTLLGSKAEEILRIGRIPVLAVGPEVTVAPEAEIDVKRLLCVVDFSSGAGRALGYAEALARRWGSQLTALYVVKDIWAEPLSTRMPGEGFLRARLIEAGWMQSIDDLAPELIVEFGPAEDRALEVAERMRAQMMVVDMPAAGHPALAAHLPGPLAYNLCARARCPVLGIRNEAV
jgi:nucleotide-binding universal stress UspA family protein